MNRQLILFLISLFALLGSLVAAWGTIQERDFQLRGYVDATEDPYIPFRVPRFGVNAELTQYTPPVLTQQLTLMETAHVNWVRQTFRWDEIEPQPGQYEWAKWDSIVEAVNQFPNLRLIVVLMNTPEWARPSPSATDATTPPADPARFADFARAVAMRYSTTIDHYQIWDEPNLMDAWGGLEPQATEYSAILQAAYHAIHSSDDNATVIAAALAPTVETGPNNISDILYLHDLYALGAKNFTDAFAAKPHGFNTSPDDRRVDDDVLNFSRIVALREEMVRQGDSAKPLWASSIGWNSLPDDWIGEPSIWGSVSADEQARYTIGALDRAEREWPWLAGMVLYHWQPDVPSDDAHWGFSLLDQQNQPTPLLIDLMQKSQPDVAENGLFSPQNPYARYSGIWRFSSLGADIGWLDDSQVDFRFRGQDIALLLRQGNYVAYLYTTIDGTQANATPRDASGNAYIILTSNSLEPELELVSVSRNLNNDIHTLHLTADRGQQRWALVGYAVSSGDLIAPHNCQFVAAVITVIVSSISFLFACRQLGWTPLRHYITTWWQNLTETGQLAISAITSLALMFAMLITWNEGTPNLLRRESVQLGLAILTGGFIYLQPGFVLALLATAVLFVIFYNRPDFGLTLTIFWAPFFLFPVELYLFAFPLAEILILITATAWFLQMLAQWGYNRQTSISQYPLPTFAHRLRNLQVLDYGVISWLVLGIVSLSWADRLPEAITELRVMIFEPALFYLVLRTTPSDKKILVRLVDAMLLAGFLVAIIGLWLFAQDQAVITAEAGARRLASVYGSPNNVGLFLGRCLPFVLAYLIVKTDQTRRVFAGIALVVMAFTVILSQSVGAIFLGIPVAVAMVAILTWRRRAGLILAGFFAILLIVSAFLLQLPRFARVLDFSSGTNFFRIRVWQSALNIIRDHPLTGIGLDQFLYAFRGQYIMPDAWQEPNLSHPHNFILDFWVRLGILGVVIFLSLQVSFWRIMLCVYAFYRNNEPLYFALVVGIMSSMVNLLSHGLVDNSVFVQDLCYVFVLLLGLAANISNIRAIDERSGVMV
jgi:O-antigen ligase